MTLRETTFAATRWTTLSAIFRATAQLLQTVILARILVPADFGLIALAGVAIAIASLFSDLGLSSALMHFKRPDRTTLATLYWLNLALSSLLALLFTVMAWPLSYAYNQPDLIPVLALLSLGFPFAALGQQFRVLAEKELNFRPLAQNEIASSLLGVLTAVIAAWSGMGVFALVASQLISTAINSFLAWTRLSEGLRPSAIFRLAAARPFITFGLHRIGDGFWNTARMQSDVFIAGLFFAPAAVATYAVPRDQALKIANTIVNPVITRVGLPLMTRVQNNPLELQYVYLKSLRVTASFNFPAYALLALFPEQIVSLLLGDQWQDAATYLRLFALWGLVRSTGNLSGSLLYAVGMVRRAHAWNLALFIFTTPLLWLAARWGGLQALAGVMLGWQALAYFLAWRFLIHPACGASFAAYNRSILPPLATTGLATIVTLLLSRHLPSGLILIAGTLLFTLAYLSASRMLNKFWLEIIAKILTIKKIEVNRGK